MAKRTTEKYCTSCGVHLVEPGYTQFPCPICETTIGRCVSCRKQSNMYTCPKCGFTGP
ncbi:MAG: DUF1610 domain-containing protein [Nitrospiraceae bacterium]|nr:DUF1610 domain-containing protein [Nitrospiraceae bacterium]